MKPKKKSIIRPVGFAILGLGILISLGTGAFVFLQPRIGGDTAMALGIPNTGNVRVLTTAIENGASRIHYKWSLIGSSNWRKASSSGDDLTLSDTYPLNSATQHGGCNVYEADLVADHATGKWTVTLHGSDGTTVQSAGTIPANASLTDAIRIVQTADSVAVGTPTRLELAQIAGKSVRLSVAR